MSPDEQANLIEALRECMSCMDSLRDYVCESSARHMVGAREAVLAADAAFSKASALIDDDPA